MLPFYDSPPMTAAVLGRLGRPTPRLDPSTLYLAAAAQDRPYDPAALRALAGELEACGSYQTAAIVRDMAAEVDSEDGGAERS